MANKKLTLTVIAPEETINADISHMLGAVIQQTQVSKTGGDMSITGSGGTSTLTYLIEDEIA